jgi:hypothetical protein
MICTCHIHQLQNLCDKRRLYISYAHMNFGTHMNVKFWQQTNYRIFSNAVKKKYKQKSVQILWK